MKLKNGKTFYDRKDKRREWEETILFRVRNDFLENKEVSTIEWIDT